jgi:hypothetical protein
MDCSMNARGHALEQPYDGKSQWHVANRVGSRAFGLQPHRAETFKPSTDPLFVEKVRDIVGLYLNPPQRVLGLWWTRKDKSKPWIACNRICR